MSSKFIHSIIFILLLALTAHEAHAAVSHDIEACEVCIHAQSNDDLDIDFAHSYTELDTDLHIKYSCNISALSLHLTPSADLIRGPPNFS